jgi:hypothetical protein
MKKRNIMFTTILLVLGCFLLSPAVKAANGAPTADGPPIVGLWDVHYTSDALGPWAETYDQWHSDGLEIETPDFAAGVCMGTWKQTATRTVHLFHVGFTHGGGCPGNVRFEETQINTVSLDRNSYDGTYDQRYYAADGTLVCEDTGTVHATRLSVH